MGDRREGRIKNNEITNFVFSTFEISSQQSPSYHTLELKQLTFIENYVQGNHCAYIYYPI